MIFASFQTPHLMDSEERVELDFSATDNGDLLLKYGPVAKARSYATTHYGYITNGIFKFSCRSDEPGTILLDRFLGWFDTRQDERISLERDHYCIKLYGLLEDANRIASMLHLPGVEVQSRGNEVGLIRRNIPYGTVWVVKVPKSFDYDEWMDAVSSSQQAQKSRQNKLRREQREWMERIRRERELERKD